MQKLRSLHTSWTHEREPTQDRIFLREPSLNLLGIWDGKRHNLWRNETPHQEALPSSLNRSFLGKKL